MTSGGLARGAIALAGGAAGAQLANILVAPILTRLYLPASFGIYAVFQNLLALMSTITCLRYEYALPVCRESRERRSLLLLCIFIAPVVCSVAAVLVLLVLTYEPGLGIVSKVGQILWLVPLGALFMGVNIAFTYWSVAEKQFKVIAQSSIYQAVVMDIFQVAVGILIGSPWTLVGGSVIGQAAGIIPIFRKLRKEAPQWPHEEKRSDLGELGRRYKKFPLLTSWSSLLNSAALSLPALAIISHYGASTAGNYALAFRVVGLPIGFIVQSVNPVYISRAAELYHKDPPMLRPLFLQLVKKLSLGCVVASPLVLVLPWAFPIIFGKAYQEAGIYAALLGVTGMLNLVGNTTNGLIVLGHNAWMSTWEVSRVIALATAFYWCFRIGEGAPQTVIITSAVLGAFYGILLILNYCLVSRLNDSHGIDVDPEAFIVEEAPV